MNQTPITQNSLRLGNPSSSNAHLFVQNGKSSFLSVKALNYIKLKRYERRLLKTSKVETYSRSLAWGHFAEMFVFKHRLDVNYKYFADNTIEHHSIKEWVGTPDYVNTKFGKVSDCKAFYPEKFLDFIDCLKLGSIDLFKKNFKEESWQLVSNACILDVDLIEPIVFLPKRKTLLEMGEMASNIDSSDQFKYKFIADDGLYGDYALPHMADESKENELNKFQFEVPQDDKDLLTERFSLVIQKINE